MNEAFRIWLSEELDRRNWSHRELARQTGFSHSFVSKAISGERSPSVNFCAKVAEVLNEPLEKVLRLAEILPSFPHSEDPVLQELIDLARTLPPNQRQQVLDYIKFISQQHRE